MSLPSYNDLGIPMVVGSVETQVDTRSVSRTRSGAVKIRLLQAGRKGTFLIQHKAINYTQKAALQAFYDANRDGEFLFTYDGITYTVAFGDALVFTPLGNGLNDIQVPIIEV